MPTFYEDGTVLSDAAQAAKEKAGFNAEIDGKLYGLTCEQWKSGHGKCGKPAFFVEVKRDWRASSEPDKWPEERIPTCRFHESFFGRRPYDMRTAKLANLDDLKVQVAAKLVEAKERDKKRSERQAEDARRHAQYVSDRQKAVKTRWSVVRKDEWDYRNTPLSQPAEYVQKPRWIVTPEGFNPERWIETTVKLVDDRAGFVVVEIMGRSGIDLNAAEAVRDAIDEALKLARTPGFAFEIANKDPEDEG